MKSNWYVINVVSGKDVKAKEFLEFDLNFLGLDKFVNEIVIPMEKYKTIRNKKTVIKERNMLSGYMLMSVSEMHPEIVQTVNSTNFIIGFLGQNKRSRKNPVAITEKEAERILKRHNDEPVEIEITVGDTVELLDGPFKTFRGEVTSINTDKMKALVDVKVFGRNTGVEVDIVELKKEY